VDGQHADRKRPWVNVTEGVAMSDLSERCDKCGGPIQTIRVEINMGGQGDGTIRALCCTMTCGAKWLTDMRKDTRRVVSRLRQG